MSSCQFKLKVIEISVKILSFVVLKPTEKVLETSVKNVLWFVQNKHKPLETLDNKCSQFGLKPKTIKNFR